MSHQVEASTVDNIPGKDWSLIVKVSVHCLTARLQPLASGVTFGTVLLCQVLRGQANLVTVSERFLVAPLTSKSPDLAVHHARRGVVKRTDILIPLIGSSWLAWPAEMLPRLPATKFPLQTVLSNLSVLFERPVQQMAFVGGEDDRPGKVAELASWMRQEVMEKRQSG